jgi:hypothetical protein
MSHPQLKLVWIHPFPMTSRSEKRKRTAQQNSATDPGGQPNDKKSGWDSFFDRKQVGTAVLVTVVTSIIGLVGASFLWMLGTYAENFENRVSNHLVEIRVSLRRLFRSYERPTNSRA